MKRAIQTDAASAHNSMASSTHSRPARQHAFPASTRPTQLAAIINESRENKALAQLRKDIQQSSRVQGMAKLAARINRSSPFLTDNEGSASKGLSTPAQLKIEIPSTLAHSERTSAADSVAGASDRGSSEQSSCGCGAKKDTGKEKGASS